MGVPIAKLYLWVLHERSVAFDKAKEAREAKELVVYQANTSRAKAFSEMREKLWEIMDEMSEDGDKTKD